MGLNNCLWGGPDEIIILSQKLNIKIQELVNAPETTLSSKYIAIDASQNRGISSELEKIFILRTNPKPRESVQKSEDPMMQIAQMESAQSSQHAQHFRLLLNIPIELLTASSKKEGKEIETITQARELYNALGPDHWKVYIDANHQGKGHPSKRKYVYDEGTHGGKKKNHAFTKA